MPYLYSDEIYIYLPLKAGETSSQMYFLLCHKEVKCLQEKRRRKINLKLKPIFKLTVAAFTNPIP